MIVLVTGAYGGIGREISEQYAAKGDDLIITGRDPHKLELLAQQLSTAGAQSVLAVAADVKVSADIKRLFIKINKQYHSLDVFVHCAGVMTESSLMMTTADAIENDIAVNLTSSILFSQQASKLMMRNKSGVITLMSSVVAHQGAVGQSVYSASKSGLTGLIKSLAKELGPFGIRVNGISPGFIDTDLVKHFDENARDDLLKKISLERLGTAADVAPVALFLASPSADYISGQIIAIDGGLVL